VANGEERASDDAASGVPPTHGKRSSRKKRILASLVISGVLAILAGAAYLEITIVMPACAAANGFLAAVREGRLDDAGRFTTLDLQLHVKLLEARAGKDPVDDEERTLVRLRKAEPVSVGIGQFTGGFTKGCASTDLADGKPVYLLVEKGTDKRWIVTGVKTERAKACESDPP